MMATRMSVRLRRGCRDRIARIARRRQTSEPEVVRQAIEAWLEGQGGLIPRTKLSPIWLGLCMVESPSDHRKRDGSSRNY